MANPFIKQARLLKALTLAKALKGKGIQKAREMSQTERDALAAEHGINSPSETTWEMAVDFYAERVHWTAEQAQQRARRAS